MKKVIFSLVLLCCLVSLAACQINTINLSSIEISGQKVEFVEGDPFETGDLVVTANYSDGSSADVTDKATVNAPEQLVAGTHTVVVSYDGKTAEYQILVKESMSGVKVDAASAKVEYVAGESLSLVGVEVYDVYPSSEEKADIKAFAVKVVDASGEEVENLNVAGDYTVVLSKNGFEASYAISVAPKHYESIQEAVDSAIANAHKVLSGTAKVNNYSEEVYEYLFGANHFQVKGSYDSQYFEFAEDGSVFGVSVSPSWEDGSDQPSSFYEPTELHLKGVDFRGAVGYAYDVFGVESLVDTLYFVGTEAANMKESCENGVYSFSYEAFIEYYYYQISVEFQLNDAAEVIVAANVLFNGYYSETVVYDEETDTYSIPAEVVEPDFVRTVEVTQVAGERVAENPYSLEKCTYESFELTDALGNEVAEGAEVAMTNGSSVELYVSNFLPEGVIAGIDEVKVTVYDEFGAETWSAYGNYFDGIITLGSYANGKYNVVISTFNVEKHLTLVVNPAELSSFGAAVYDENSWSFAEAEQAKVYVGVEIELSAVVNEGADKSFTAELKEASESATLVAGDSSYYFSATEPGEYVVVLTSASNKEFSDTIKVIVEAAPEVSEILNGTYEYYDWSFGTITAVFTPAYPGAVNGMVKISSVGGWETIEGEVAYSYSPAGLYMEAINGFSVGIGSNYNVVALFNGWEQGSFTKVEVTADAELAGTFNAEFVHPKNGMSYSMTLVFNADGTGSYSLMNGGYEGTFAFFAANGVIEFSDVVATFGSEVLLSGSYSEAGVYGITVIDGGEIALDYVGNAVEEEGEITAAPIVGVNKVNASWFGEVCYFTASADGTYTFSVDESAAVLGINYEMNASFTLTLYAGDSVEIVVLSAANTGKVEVVELTITQA